MKNCCRCKKKKRVEEFNFKNKLLGIRQKACKKCTRLEIRKHYQNNKEYYLKKSRIRNRKHRIIVKKYIYEYLLTHSCVDCGEKDPVVLEFDHISSKLQNVSTIVQRNYPINTIKKEVVKCEVRCANCHRRKTAKDYYWYKGNMHP